jgi:hypothetical protein
LRENFNISENNIISVEAENYWGFIKAQNWTQNRMQNLKKKCWLNFYLQNKRRIFFMFLKTQFLGFGAVFASFLLQF